MATTECPRCEAPLPNPRLCAACGWKPRARADKSAPREPIPCAHDTCELPATVRIETPTGWANLCEPHYVMHHDNRARAWCAERGLLQQPNESKAQWRTRTLAYLRAGMKPKTFDDAKAAEDQWASEA